MKPLKTHVIRKELIQNLFIPFNIIANAGYSMVSVLL